MKSHLSYPLKYVGNMGHPPHFMGHGMPRNHSTIHYSNILIFTQSNSSFSLNMIAMRS